jgi:hypothetical protein
LIRLHDARHVIAPARFDQQYIDIRILGESACYHRTRGAGATDDEIVVRFQLSCELPLVDANALRKVGIHSIEADSSSAIHPFHRESPRLLRYLDRSTNLDRMR